MEPVGHSSEKGIESGQESRPVEESFRCDGEGCGKVLPLRLLRRGAAVQVGDSIYCPRCRIRVVGARRQKVDAMMVASVLVLVLAFPVGIGMFLSTGRSNDKEGTGFRGPSGPPPLLPDLAARRDGSSGITREEVREEMEEVLREFLRERSAPPAILGEPPPAEPSPAAGGANSAEPSSDRGGDRRGTGARAPNPIEPETASAVDSSPPFDFDDLDRRIDEATRAAMIERVPAGTEDTLPRGIDGLAAIRIAGNEAWSDALAARLGKRGDQDLVGRLGTFVLSEIGAARPPEPRDRDIDWTGADQNARRILRKGSP